MHKALKQLFTFAFALVFMTGVAFAQDSQDGDITQYGFDHDADIEQVGTSNDAFITQGAVGDETNVNINDHLAEVYQNGVDNYATIDQDGDGNPDGFIDQIGDFNRAEQTQEIYGSDRALADIDQTGDNNRAFQTQGYYGGTSGLVMKAEAFQTGNDNYADQTQDGSSQLFRALIEQNGNDNWARQSQVGTTGFNFTSDIIQNGDMNRANVDQSN